MKTGVTYKTIGDVADIICGQDYKSVQDDYGKYPVYGTGGIMCYASQYRCPANSIIIGRKGSINNPLFVEESFWNVDTAFGVVPKCTEVIPKYFFYFCCSYDFTKHDVSVTIPSLRRTDIIKIQLPVPPINDQERIVAELDLLTGIIDKQRAQLRELDTLARSIFYDMFGDPVENEKQWKKQRLGDYCEVSSSKRVLVKDVVNSGIPFLRGTELTALNKASSSEDVNFSMFITPEHYKKVKTITGVPKKGDILIPSINSEGITWIVDTDEPFYFKDGRVLWIHMNTKTFSSEYLKFAISGILKSTYDTLTSGATFLELKLFIIRDLPIPIPPLNLQQSFARKIASIESQKSTITRSIAETQKLFDYTMDKYFG